VLGGPGAAAHSGTPPNLSLSLSFSRLDEGVSCDRERGVRERERASKRERERTREREREREREGEG